MNDGSCLACFMSISFLNFKDDITIQINNNDINNIDTRLEDLEQFIENILSNRQDDDRLTFSSSIQIDNVEIPVYFLFIHETKDVVLNYFYYDILPKINKYIR